MNKYVGLHICTEDYFFIFSSFLLNKFQRVPGSLVKMQYFNCPKNYPIEKSKNKSIAKIVFATYICLDT